MNLHTIAVCLGFSCFLVKINFKEKHQAEYQVTHLTQSSLYIHHSLFRLVGLMSVVVTQVNIIIISL